MENVVYDTETSIIDYADVETDEEIEAQRGWGLFVLFCVTKFGAQAR